MSDTAPRSGVLLVGFGGPDSIESVRPFMCELMGREPSDEVVDEVCMRYLAIGGSSPLPEIAQGIASALSEKLAEMTGSSIPVAVGMRYTAPFIRDAVAALSDAGVESVVMVSLSPFESKVTHGAYREAIAEAMEGHDSMQLLEAPLIGSLEAFAEFASASGIAALGKLESPAGALVVFSAHSLPLSDLSNDDPYVKGLRQAVDRAAEYAGWEHGRDDQGEPLLEGISTYGALGGEKQPWVLAYQSKGKRPGEWLVPSVEEVIDAAHAANVPSIAMIPIGFMTDHLETLYDIDIEAAGRAYDYDMDFARGPVPNDHEHLIESLAGVIRPLL